MIIEENDGKIKVGMDELSFDQELFRKGIHISSLLIPSIYVFVTKDFALQVLIPLTFGFVLVDVLGKRVPSVQRLLYRYFGKILRKHEVDEPFTLNGASWVMLSACLMVFIFPKLIAITALSILTISDLSAALIGRKFGKTPFFGKSLEGSIAFLISAFCVVSFIGYMVGAPNAFFIFGIISAFGGCLAEASSKFLKLDDNLSIPATIGTVLWLGNLIAQNFNESYAYLLN